MLYSGPLTRIKHWNFIEQHGCENIMKWHLCSYEQFVMNIKHFDLTVVKKSKVNNNVD